jgi:D-alanyl-D-alanine carboxypeptidase
MPGLNEAFDRIGAALEHHVANSHAAGAALAVTDHEEILGVAVRGVADAAAATAVRPQTRFQIGSISKSFAGIIVLQEVEAGRLDLHASVNTILPWLELPEPLGPLTLHHLMSHTAGLAIGTEEGPTLNGALHILRGVPATTPPGDRFWYSNDGWKIVGACLERVTGTPIHDLIHERILGPLGMHASVAAITDAERADLAVGYTPMLSDRPPQLRHALVPANWIVSNTADGSIISDVVDMSAYARLLLARGDVPGGRGGRVLSDEMFARLITPVIEFEPSRSYGYGLWEEEVDGHRWVGHTGGMVGYTAQLATSPDEGLGVVVLQNGDGDKNEIVRYALAAVRASLAGVALPDVWAPPAPTRIPAAPAFVGHYHGDDGREMTVDVEDDGLRVTMGPLSVRLERDPLDPDPGDSFLVAHPALERFPMEFARDENGDVTHAFHGETWFRADAYRGEDPPALDDEQRALVGLYRSNIPWSPVLRIFPRMGGLYVQWPPAAGDPEGDGPLLPLPDGSFAVGSQRDPRRLHFEGEADGRAVVAVFNGGRWYRSFES